jgi:hypothetical protein
MTSSSRLSTTPSGASLAFARSKVPREGSRGLRDATTESAQVKAWWTVYPDCNIGLRTGVVFDVVDLDGPEAVKEISAARGNGDRLRGPCVRTPRGCHLYVQPTGLGNRARILPGVDYRGVGGYVVAPPSINERGQRYQWAGARHMQLEPSRHGSPNSSNEVAISRLSAPRSL